MQSGMNKIFLGFLAAVSILFIFCLTLIACRFVDLPVCSNSGHCFASPPANIFSCRTFGCAVENERISSLSEGRPVRAVACSCPRRPINAASPISERRYVLAGYANAPACAEPERWSCCKPSKPR